MYRSAAGAGCPRWVLVGLLLLGCGVPEPQARNLLLISVDTLRADRLGFLGHERPTSRALDALAAEATVFERAYSESGWTLPSMATLLSGRHARDHGATRFTRAVDPRLPTLASLLVARGYDTRAFVSHVLLQPRYGFDRGFQVFDASVLYAGDPHRISSAAPLTDRLLDSLESQPLVEPFFVWVHYFDPHMLYLAHPEFAHFGSTPIDRYDGEIAHLDRHVARLLDSLRGRGLLDRTVVVMTADHGEEFGEHGGRLHDTLFEEVVRVPLLVRVPGRAAARSQVLARQVDVAPTALAALSLRASPPWPGRDLLSESGSGEADPPIFFERDVPSKYRQRGVRQGRFKLVIVTPGPGDPDPGAPPEAEPEPSLRPGVALYDLAEDPGEQRNLADAQPQRVAELMVLLREHFGVGAEAGRVAELDPVLRDQLRDLGYLEE